MNGSKPEVLNTPRGAIAIAIECRSGRVDQCVIRVRSKVDPQIINTLRRTTDASVGDGWVVGIVTAGGHSDVVLARFQLEA